MFGFYLLALYSTAKEMERNVSLAVFVDRFVDDAIESGWKENIYVIRESPRTFSSLTCEAF